MPKGDKRTRAKNKRKAKQAKNKSKELKWSEELERKYQAKWDFWKELSPDIIELNPPVSGNVKLEDLDVIPPKGEGKAYYGLARDKRTDKPFPVFIYLRPMTIEEVEAFSTKEFVAEWREAIELGEAIAFRRFSDNEPKGGKGRLSVFEREQTTDEVVKTGFFGFDLKQAERDEVRAKKMKSMTSDEVIEHAKYMIQELEMLNKLRSLKR